jgi:hypothetical protein
VSKAPTKRITLSDSSPPLPKILLPTSIHKSPARSLLSDFLEAASSSLTRSSPSCILCKTSQVLLRSKRASYRRAPHGRVPHGRAPHGRVSDGHVPHRRVSHGHTLRGSPYSGAPQRCSFPVNMYEIYGNLIFENSFVVLEIFDFGDKRSSNERSE